MLFIHLYSILNTFNDYWFRSWMQISHGNIYVTITWRKKRKYETQFKTKHPLANYFVF